MFSILRNRFATNKWMLVSHTTIEITRYDYADAQRLFKFNDAITFLRSTLYGTNTYLDSCKKDWPARTHLVWYYIEQSNCNVAQTVPDYDFTCNKRSHVDSVQTSLEKRGILTFALNLRWRIKCHIITLQCRILFSSMTWYAVHW